MSLFQFGFSISYENIALAATHLPDQEDTILGHNEYNQVAAAVVDLARLQPWQWWRSKYHWYSGEDHAKIAKYSVSMETRKAFNIFLRNI